MYGSNLQHLLSSDHTHPRKAEMICLVALFPEMSPEADSMQPITTEKQGTMNPSEIYRPGGRYAIFHSGSLFNMIMGCIIIQEVKGLTNVQEEDLCKISGSLFTLFTCFYMVVACIINVLSALPVK